MKQKLLDYANKLKSAGLTVYLPAKDHCDWIIFGDDKNVGYCQYDSWSGFTFSSKHVANRQTGTGFQIHERISSPTVQHAKDTFVLAPDWASSSDRRSVVKYKGVEDYISRETILKYKRLA